MLQRLHKELPANAEKTFSTCRIGVASSRPSPSIPKRGPRIDVGFRISPKVRGGQKVGAGLLLPSPPMPCLKENKWLDLEASLPMWCEA